MDFNIGTFIIIALIIGIFIFIGREFENRYPSQLDYLSSAPHNDLKNQFRLGAFLVLDYISDLCYPGKIEYAYDYKHRKRTPEQIRQAEKTQGTTAHH